MFYEERFIYFEIIPSRDKPSKKPKERIYNPEIPAEVKEKEKQEQEDSERVAEKLMDELEMLGIKCLRCGSKNVKENKDIPKGEEIVYLKCADCDYEWDELK